MTVPGVRTAEVDFDNKEVAVSYEAPATLEAMIAAVAGAGHYTATLKHEGKPEVHHTIAPLGGMPAVDGGGAAMHEH